MDLLNDVAESQVGGWDWGLENHREALRTPSGAGAGLQWEQNIKEGNDC